MSIKFFVPAGDREEECLALRKHILHDAKRWINVQSLSEDCTVGPEDWLVLNIELSEDSGYVNYPIHQTAVITLHHPTNVTRMISILEHLLIERLLMPIKAVNDPRPDSSAKKNRSTSPQGKGKRTESEQEKVTVAIVNNANNPSYISEQFLQF